MGSLKENIFEWNIFVSSNMSFFVPQHTISPEIGVHGLPVNNFSHSGSGGVNLSRISVGLDLNEPASSNWSSTTSIKFEVGCNLLH